MNAFDHRWIGWLAVIVFLLVARMLRAIFRRRAKTDPMARLDAASQRILKEQRQAAGSVPLTAQQQTNAQRARERQVRTAKTPGKTQTQPSLTQVGRPSAITRRTGLGGAGREPVIQRRR
jgi:hypothetical protein